MSEVLARVTGKVQGVSYRAAARKKAQGLGVTGWVRNLPDGSVELLASGPDDAVESLIEWCRRGPSGAEVEQVHTRDASPEELVELPESFDIRR
ncbi:acylphosphatase [Nesterenkonia sp. NBAIMH1]|uniref:acylphosphatase n=1 Tax=Nesterenkonia sp. NBAIMH1 TaxID=2600320 RepID=UPI0011B5665E|nr:acylphosphatase [Nesterenkonia sp. NBAIMH1]